MALFKPRFRPCPALLRCGRHPTRRFATETQSPSDYVRIVEVGARDGLQNEKKSIPLQTKIELIERLANTGVKTIEAGAFVPAKWVPQVGIRFNSVHSESNYVLKGLMFKAID